MRTPSPYKEPYEGLKKQALLQEFPDPLSFESVPDILTFLAGTTVEIACL